MIVPTDHLDFILLVLQFMKPYEVKLIAEKKTDAIKHKLSSYTYHSLKEHKSINNICISPVY